MTTLQASLRARYGDAAPAIASEGRAGLAMLEQLLAHRSVRSYLPQALPDGALEAMVAAAQSASTSSNLQVWSLIAVEDQQRKNRLAEWCGDQQHVRTAPLFLVWVADLSRLDRLAARQQAPADANRYTEQFVVAAIDASLAAQNAVVAAEAQGLGTVYIGGLRNHADRVAQELKLPAHAFPLFGLCVGVPDPARPASVKPRLAQSVVLHREVYADPASGAESAAVDGYDAIMRQFQAGEGMAQAGWSGPAAKRVAGAQSLSGRDRLRDYLGAQGFELL